jgi:hypothetical protein
LLALNKKSANNDNIEPTAIADNNFFALMPKTIHFLMSHFFGGIRVPRYLPYSGPTIFPEPDIFVDMA